MAYIDQVKKQKIAAALKLVVPAGWKYSLAVHHHSTIICTVASAPFDLIGAFAPSQYFDPTTATHTDVNPYHVRAHVADECVADVFERMLEALNTDNHDRSDISTDYFDVGHYVTLKIGRWNRPFTVTAPAPLALV